ncbi:MAG: ComEC/Rec2 family competence protein, partial [Candidatus Omnitrophota bacterium]
MKRPLLVPILFFLTGVLIAGIFQGFITSRFIPAIIVALFLAFFILVALIRKEKYFYPVLCVFFFFLGTFRYISNITPAEDDVSKFITEESREAVLYGTVVSDPEWKGAYYARHQKFSLKVNKLLAGGDERAVSGTVLVNLFSEKENPEVGDVLVLGGEVSLPRGKTNPAGFDYKTYLNRNGIRVAMYSREGDYYLKTGADKTPAILIQRYLFGLRKKSSKVIDKFLWGAPKAITESVILGQRSGLADKINDIFIKTGTMHILAVSGLHVGILAAVLLGLFRLVFLPRRLAYILTILAICAFALFAGARPSSLRAATMGSFVLLGLMLGRKTDVLNALALSALLIIFFQPGQLFQAGFILSYMAVLSIIFVMPLTDKLFGAKRRMYFAKALSVSLAVWVGMIPVTAFYFKIITPSVFLANLVAVPVLSILVVLGFALVIAGSLGILLVAGGIAAALNFFAPFLINAMQLLAKIP